MAAEPHQLSTGRGHGAAGGPASTPVVWWRRRSTWVAVASVAVILCGFATMARLATRRVPPPGVVRTIKSAGMPTLYVVELPRHRQFQLYLDPGAPGFDGIHMTFFDAQGHELSIAGALTVTVRGRAGTAVALPALQEGPGHFYSDFDFAPGTWRLEIHATDDGGQSLRATVNVAL